MSINTTVKKSHTYLDCVRANTQEVKYEMTFYPFTARFCPFHLCNERGHWTTLRRLERAERARNRFGNIFVLHRLSPASPTCPQLVLLI